MFFTSPRPASHQRRASPNAARHVTHVSQRSLTRHIVTTRVNTYPIRCHMWVQRSAPPLCQLPTIRTLSLTLRAYSSVHLCDTLPSYSPRPASCRKLQRRAIPIAARHVTHVITLLRGITRRMIFAVICTSKGPHPPLCQLLTIRTVSLTPRAYSSVYSCDPLPS